MINKNYEWLTDKPFAHRGLFNNTDVPENSKKAFSNAVEHGLGMEMDVQMTSDGVLVVFHDDNMKRMTGLDKDIRETPYDEIKDLTLLDTQEKIPLFEEFLALVAGKVPLIIEIKTHKNVGGVEQKVVDALKSYKGNYCVESFNPFIVRWFYKNAPHILRGQLSCDHNDSDIPAWQKLMLKKLWLCKWNKSQFIAYDAKTIAQQKAVKKYSKSVPIICWTIKSQQQYDNLREHFDGVIFEGFLPSAETEGAKL